MTSMRLDTIYFNLIKNGKKIYETRVFDEKRRKLKLMEVVTFKDRGSNKTFKALITELSYFSNFKDAIESAGLKKVLPNARSLKDGVEMYEQFPHSEGTYKDGATKYGVLRIKFGLIK